MLDVILFIWDGNLYGTVTTYEPVSFLEFPIVGVSVSPVFESKLFACALSYSGSYRSFYILPFIQFFPRHLFRSAAV